MVSPVQDFEIENVTVVVNAPALKETVDALGIARSNFWSTRVHVKVAGSAPAPIEAGAAVRFVATAKPAAGALFEVSPFVRSAVVANPGPVPDQAGATLCEIVSVPATLLQKTEIQTAPDVGRAPGIPAVVDDDVAAYTAAPVQPAGGGNTF